MSPLRVRLADDPHQLSTPELIAAMHDFAHAHEAAATPTAEATAIGSTFPGVRSDTAALLVEAANRLGTAS